MSDFIWRDDLGAALACDGAWKKAPPGSALERIFAAIALWRAQGRPFAGHALAPDDEGQWEALVRRYFDRDAFGCISVNAANMCPALTPVSAMGELVRRLMEVDISFALRGELAEAGLVHGLDAVKTWIGLGGLDAPANALLALTANATQANNCINNGLVASGFFNPARDNVVVWDVNHPTNHEAWLYRKATQGWGPDSVRIMRTKLFAQTVSDDEARAGVVPSDPAGEDEIVAALLRLVDRNTKVVSLSWQSNESGLVLPMRRIVEELRAINKDIHIHADSAQAFGVLDMRLEATGVDSIAGSFHKWPCGPRMVGVIYMNPATGAAERFAPGAWGYDEHINTPAHYGFAPESGGIDATARRFSYLGQQNDVTLVAAWMTALFHTGHFHPGVTPKRVEARTHALGTRLKNALYRHLPRMFPDFREDAAWRHIVTPTTNDALRSAVYLFRTPEGVAAGDVMQHVYAKHRFAIAYLQVMGQDLLRVSPSICNLAGDVEGVVAAIADVVEALRAGTLPSSPPSRAYI